MLTSLATSTAADIDPESGDTILTGSWREEDQLQLWDYGSGQLINTLEWGSRCALYAAQSSDDGKRIAAGGSGSNELRVFDTNSLQCLGKASDLNGGVYSLDWCVALPQRRCMKSALTVQLREWLARVSTHPLAYA